MIAQVLMNGFRRSLRFYAVHFETRNCCMGCDRLSSGHCELGEVEEPPIRP
jgi:hypothetical protein